MSKTLKRISAGSLELLSLTDRVARRDGPVVRAAKHKASSEAQRRMNLIYSVQKLELLLAANFPTAGSGLVVTLTYDEAHRPRERRQAVGRFKYFLKLLRAARHEAGLPEPVVIHNIEVLTSATGRWHHHMVIDNTGRDLELLRRCWIYGSEIEAEPLRVDGEKNHESLARYMAKECREAQDYGAKAGARVWSYTKNAKKPERDVVTVPDDYRLEAPEGAAILIDEQRRTEWASWHVMKLRYGGEGFAKRPRARRKRPRG